MKRLPAQGEQPPKESRARPKIAVKSFANRSRHDSQRRCFPRQKADIEVAFLLQSRMGCCCAPPRPACRVCGAGQETEASLYYAYQYAEQHSRHWPESSIKSSQANAGGEHCLRALRREISPQRRREHREGKIELCVFRPARLWRLPALGEQPPKASRTRSKRRL